MVLLLGFILHTIFKFSTNFSANFVWYLQINNYSIIHFSHKKIFVIILYTIHWNNIFHENPNLIPLNSIEFNWFYRPTDQNIYQIKYTFGVFQLSKKKKQISKHFGYICIEKKKNRTILKRK